MSKISSNSQIISAVECFENDNNQTPCCLIASSAAFERICADLSIESPIAAKKGFIGRIFGIPVWIDERFNQPVLLGRK